LPLTIRALGLATLVAIGGTIVFQPTNATAAGPVALADPASPTPAPSALPSATPTPDPTSTPAPTPTAPTATVFAAVVAPTTTTTTTTSPTRLTARQRIVRIALRQRYDSYVPGGVGPSTFDCSGLVRYVYNQAGVGGKLGGGHSARMMYLWGRYHHLNSRRNPRIGDVAVWGYGSHVGIYIGRGRVISALNPRQDIRITGVYALGAPFTTYIHTRLP
jgi:cell wall-associated NlpC family hydrolase